MNLTAISSTVFEGCSLLTTITAPFFSTTIFDNDRVRFKEVLIEACFHPAPSNDPSVFLSDFDTDHFLDDDMYYDMKPWAEETRDENNRLPLCTAAAISLRWVKMKLIFDANMPAIYQMDVMTGLPLFMLSAVGQDSDMESTYHLLKEFPSVIDNWNAMK